MQLIMQIKSISFMKKSLIAILFILFSVAAHSQTKGKTGHLDISALYSAMPELIAANEEYLNFYKELDTAIKIMENDFRAKMKFYEDHSSTMSDFLKQSKEKEINDLQTQIKSFRKSAQEELTKKQASLLEPIQKKAKDAIQSVAKEKGYKYILNYNENNILYAEPSDDIMPLVKQKLGIK